MANKAITEKDFRNVFTSVYRAKLKWRQIGIQLKIDPPELDDIEIRYLRNDGSERCLEEVIKLWLKQVRPTWDALLRTLKSVPVGEEAIAYDIETTALPKNCYITGRELEVAEIGEEATAVLYTLDIRGLACEEETQDISCELVPTYDAPTVRGSVEKGKGNTYEIRYRPTTRGQHQLHVKVEGEHVKGSPFNVTVKVPVEKLGTPIRTIGGLQAPWGVAVNERGEIIVAENYTHRVSIFSPQGEKIRSFGTSGSGPGQFNCPEGVAVYKDGNILVADWYNHRVQKFSPDGKFITSVGTHGNGQLQFNYPIGIAIRRDGRIYVCDGLNHRVQILNPDLTFHSSFGCEGTDNGQFDAPWDVAMDSRDNVYVADYYNHRIQVFTGDGQFLRMFGKKGSGDGELYYPASITIDSDDMVFVGESSNNRVSVFTSQGQFVRTIGARGHGPGQFFGPCGIAIDRHGFIYVSDTDNIRLQIF